MSRETAEAKAKRLLVTGRVRITAVGRFYVSASVGGDSGPLWVAGYELGRWHCSCPCRTGCSHIRALQLVADPAQSVRAVAS
jgi:hypothetical protein